MAFRYPDLKLEDPKLTQILTIFSFFKRTRTLAKWYRAVDWPNWRVNCPCKRISVKKWRKTKLKWTILFRCTPSMTGISFKICRSDFYGIVKTNPQLQNFAEFWKKFGIILDLRVPELCKSSVLLFNCFLIDYSFDKLACNNWWDSKRNVSFITTLFDKCLLL